MTEHRTSSANTATATVPPASHELGTRLLKKVHATRPMLAEREHRKNLAELPPRKN